LQPPSEIHEITAGPEHATMRVDRFLADAIGSLSRSRVKALMETGHAMVDGAALTDPSATVRPGGAYRLKVPPPVPATPLPENIALDVLFEDKHLIVLNKPAGLVVHPAPGNADGTLVNALLHHADDLSGIGGEARPGIVHRLDKETSGIMVVAKSQQAHIALSEAFATRDLDREYLALCWGLPAEMQGEVEGNIGRHPTDRKRMAVVERGGKTALTHYWVEEAFGTAGCLMRLKLATGRTHQIRVHLSHIGHPVMGDPVYLRRIPAAAAGLAKAAREAALAFPRQALHAATLGFRHPVTGEALRFSAEPPADMALLLECLRT
jgi:23S rRNA pseudouridine1911/1915/1917 synthase